MKSILAFDQAMRKTGYAATQGGKLYRVGVLSTPARYIRVEAIPFQRDLIMTTVHELAPELVVLEGVHFTRSYTVQFLLGGLIHVLMVALTDDGYPYKILESHEIMKAIHLTPGTSRKDKAVRARAIAEKLCNKEGGLTDDECSALVMLDIACARWGTSRLEEMRA